MTGSNPKYRKNTYIIAIICTILSIWLANKDSNPFSWNEIGYSFLFFQISSKSYIAFAIILYTTLGISLSYYSCPYELYRSFHSANKTYEPQKDEKILINKSFGLAILCCVLIWKIIIMHLIRHMIVLMIFSKNSLFLRFVFGFLFLSVRTKQKIYIYL